MHALKQSNLIIITVSKFIIFTLATKNPDDLGEAVQACR